MSKEKEQKTKAPEAVQGPQPPRTPLEAVAAMAQATFPNSKVIVLVDTQGQFQMAGIGILSGSDRLGMLAAAELLAKHEFACGIAPVRPEVKA